MAGKRARQPATATNPSKSSMEEAADALAGVEGALTGNKRRGMTAPGSSSKKKGEIGATTAVPTSATATAMAEGEAAKMSRSTSMEQLAEVAGSILKEEEDADVVDQDDKRGGSGAWYATNDVAFAAAAAAAAAVVPNPMADADAAVAAAAVPTGFRKKPAVKKERSTTSSAKAAPAAPSSSSSSAEPASAPPAAAAAASAPAGPDDGNGNAGGKSRKTQITYTPDVTMTKEQLTAWRREMRRVRNRESAAASRRKVRDRIDELEDEVEIWKRRYQEVMARLGQTDGDREEEEREVRREVDSATAAGGTGTTTDAAVDDAGTAHSQVV